MQQEIITGIDIGSSNIRVVIGQIDVNGQIQIISAIEGHSNGINRSVITGIEDAVSSISSVLEKTERVTGVPIEHAFVGISGSHIISQPSHGVVAIAKANGEIEENDVERVINAAQTVITPPNYEILHIIPQTFTIDRQTGIKDPIGMSGIRLEVDAQIIEGLSSPIKNLTIFPELFLSDTINGLSFPISTPRALLTKSPNGTVFFFIFSTIVSVCSSENIEKR